uniref:Putative secreted protein n=1 Tax=Anopheles darlingi TaxID=43151 RepID=A0A2M4DA10_ANODA
MLLLLPPVLYELLLLLYLLVLLDEFPLIAAVAVAAPAPAATALATSGSGLPFVTTDSGSCRTPQPAPPATVSESGKILFSIIGSSLVKSTFCRGSIGVSVAPSLNWMKLRNAEAAAATRANFLLGPVPTNFWPSTTTEIVKSGACTGPVCDSTLYTRLRFSSFSTATVFFVCGTCSWRASPGFGRCWILRRFLTVGGIFTVDALRFATRRDVAPGMVVPWLLPPPPVPVPECVV